MKFGIRNNIIALFIFYLIFFTFLNAFYGSSVSIIPSYLQGGINFFNTAYHTISTPISFSSGIIGALTSIGRDILFIILLIGDLLFLIVAVISLVGYYPYVIIAYTPAPINEIILSISLVVLLVDIITAIRIFGSGVSGNDE